MTQPTQSKPIMFSGIQPSGDLHIGHYIGAIKQWVTFQDSYECIFCVADLHAITVKQDPKILQQRCYDLAALYIACGLDPDKNIIFIQSQVPAHTQLTWILNCFTYMGELNRMTQFKDKSQHKKNINVGLFNYPVLQASDILLYNTNLVPVGYDQKQHLELTREIASRFNNRYGNVFTEPKPCIPKEGNRIMGLQTPNKKMSKSDINKNNCIFLLDSPKDVAKKIKRAVTDSEAKVCFSEDKPGISNLLTLYSLISDKTIAELEKQYQNQSYSVFKEDVAEAVIKFLTPIQEKFHVLRKDKENMEKILKQGAEIALKRSNKIIKKVHEALGLIL